MLIKSKVFSTTSDPRLRAGDEAEKQMAFLLDRRFEERDDVFLLHDLRIQKGKHAFQIDHLVITRYGISLIESKSIHSTISIVRHDERREHWSRTFRGREEGIPSPVRQVQEQARLLQAFLNDNREEILGKVLFVVQRGYKNCPFDTYVGVSTSATFNLAKGTRLPEHVFKADEVAPEIEQQLNARIKRDTLLNLNPLAELPWEISKDDARLTARFLQSCHQPLHPVQPQDTAAPDTTARNPQDTTPPPLHAPATLQPGAPCPACNKYPIAYAFTGPVKADGSRDRLLACLGNKDASCTWRGPLEATDNPPPAPAPASIPALAPIAAVEPASVSEPAAAYNSKPRSTSNYFCFACRASISKDVAKYCWDRKERFGGKAYCRGCQGKF